MSKPESYQSMEEWAYECEARANMAEDRIEELEGAILKHHKRYANLENYTKYGEGDVELWLHVDKLIQEGE